MTDEQHNELQKSFDDISKVLEDKTLSPEKRKDLEIMKAKLAGAMMSSWLPYGTGRKILMLIVAILAGHFLLEGSYVPAIIAIVLLGFFSPRVVGEVAVLVGLAKGN